MKQSLPLVILFILITLQIAGCSKHKENGSEENEYRGNLVELLDQFYDPKRENNLSTYCDIKLKNAKYAIARDLEKYKDRIQRYNQSKNLQTNPGSLVHIGTFSFAYTPPTNIPSKWIKENLPSWYDLVGYHRALSEGGGSDENWSYLNKQVRSLIFDDKSRILNWVNFSFEHSDEKKLKSLHKVMTDCISDVTCSLKNFDPNIEKWALTKSFYTYHINKIKSAQDKETLSKAKDNFLRRINDDIQTTFDYGFTPKNQADKSTKTLIVRIDFSVFAPRQRKLANIIEKAWSVFGFNLKIETEILEPFTFFNLDISPNHTRASVKFGDTYNVMKISENVSLNTIIHEIGHVIGLEDRYYTLWNEDSCQYTSQYNKADIMSDSDAGRVLPENINRIIEKYFK